MELPVNSVQAQPVEVEILGGSGVVAAFVLEFGEVVKNVEILGFEFVVFLKSLEELTTVARILNLLRHVGILKDLIQGISEDGIVHDLIYREG